MNIGGEIMYREEFPILNNNIIYFDSAATALKPKSVVDAMNDYYLNYSANVHRGDYNMSIKVDSMYEGTREKIKSFINAPSKNNIVFTYGATDSINKAVFGFFINELKRDDEVLITVAEHASNILPWFELQDKIGIKVKYIPLDDDYKVTLDNVKKSITPKTKVISLASITNVIGDSRPIKEITKYAHENGIIILVDAAQSITHIKTDVIDLDVDFLAFSAHKMGGPTGVGVLYVSNKYLDKINPTTFGGDMNASFEMDGTRVYDEMPRKLEAGTGNIAGVIGLGATIDFINKLGIENINLYEKELRNYLIQELKKIDKIKIYNENSESSIVTFNYDDIFAQDLAIYLNKYDICIRAGNHCAKILKNAINIKNTCRISLSFYNTKNEIDKLIEVLKNQNIKNELF
jgi:cysteine desulfurase/selenocysteine lyase